MGIISLSTSFIYELATFGPVLISLPMALDLLGPPSFLLLALLFTVHYFVFSTFRLVLKDTILAPLITVFTFLSPLVSFGCLLLTLYYYLLPPEDSRFGHALVNVLPYLYASVLRWVSPLFTLIEGVSTLLMIQMFGRVGKGWADVDEKEEGLEWRSLVGLFVAALVYSLGLWLVYFAFPQATFPAFLLGAALASTVFLSLIGFSLRRTNVLETSLVLLYVAYSSWLSGVESAMEPRQFGSGWISQDWAVPKSVPATTVKGLLGWCVSSGLDSVWAVTGTLPIHLLISLVYRVAALYIAAHIVPRIRQGWANGNDEAPDWDGRSLGGVPSNMRISTVILSYRRAILIAVYTHLLLLDGGSQTWWRWANIALFLAVWSLEITLDADDDAESVGVGRWKSD